MSTFFPIDDLPFAYHLMYPLTRTPTYSTKIQQFMGDAEVAYVAQLPVVKFTLVYTQIDADSKATIQSFFNSQGGASTSSFSLVVDGITYNNLIFDTDVLEFVQDQVPNHWSVNIPLRQTRPDSSTFAAPSGSPVYPTLASGALTQKPYHVASQFLRATNNMPSGPRFSYSYRTDPLKAFTLTYSSITDADLATLEAFFVAMCGRYGLFEFTDVEGNVLENIRFDQDTLPITYKEKNSNSVTVKLCQIGYA